MNYVLFIYENPLFNIRSNPRNLAVIIETAVFKCIPPRMAFVTATSSWPRGEGRKAGGKTLVLRCYYLPHLADFNGTLRDDS